MFSKFSVKKPYTVLVGVVLVIVLGVVSFTKMTADLLPNINLPYVIVMTTYVGASPETVEMAVTKPIESSMATVSNIESLSSVSSENYSIVIMEFAQTANMDSVSLEIRESLDQLKSYWDESVGNPIIMKLNPDMLPVMIAAVGVENMTMAEASDYAENEIIPELESIEGVASASASGLIEEQVNVIIRQEKLDKVNEQIFAAIDSSMEEAEKELADGKNEALKGKNELADAKAEIEKGQSELDKGKAELESGKAQLNQKKQETANTLAATKTELLTAKADLEAAKIDITTDLATAEGLNKGLKQAQDGLVALEQGIVALETLKTTILGMDPAMLPFAKDMILSQLPEEMADLKAALSAVDWSNVGEADSTDMTTVMGVLNSVLNPLVESKAELLVTIEDLDVALTALTKGMDFETYKKTMNKQLTEINNNIAKIDEGLTELEKGALTATIEFGNASSQISLGEYQMTDAQAELDAAKTQLEDGQAQLDDALKQIEDGIKQLQDAKEDAYDQADMTGVLTVDTVKSLLTAQNFSMPAGYVTEEGIDYLIRVGDKPADMEEMADLPLLNLHMDGVDVIRLSDVADVFYTDNSDTVYTNVNGNPGVVLTLQKQTGYSTGEVSDLILERFEKLESKNPDLKMVTLMDQGIYIDLVMDSIIGNVLSGALLAILILIIFLRDLRPTFIIACSIPISLVTAVVCMYFSGITLNVISLSGLALGVGMLVDNSIVVIENIYRLRNLGYSKAEAAIKGAKEVGGAILASTLTTVCVFLPIVFTEGITRQLFVDMGLTIAYSLLASLVIALTVVPAMSSKMLNKQKEKKEGKFSSKMMGVYRKFLAIALKGKPIVFIVVIALLFISVAAALSRGTAFMPSMDSTQLSITVQLPKGTPLSETKVATDEVVDILKEFKDIKDVGAMSGGSSYGMMVGMGSSDAATNATSIYVTTNEEKSMSNEELAVKIMEATAHIDAEIYVETATMDMSALGGSGISLQIKGKELDTLYDLAKEAASVLEGIEGVDQVSDGMEETTEELRIIVDKDKAMDYGLTVAQIFAQIAPKLADPSNATTLVTQSKDYGVYVVHGNDSTLNRELVKELTVEGTNEDGETEDIPLTDLVTFENKEGLSSINRSEQTRYINVSASIADGYNVGLVSQDVETAFKYFEIPDGYAVEFAGENEMINEAMEQVGLMLLLALLFMYLIMVAQFQSLLSPFIIMFTVPLAFTGGFLGLYMTGSEVSVIAMIGFVMLSGIIVNNGIVLIDYANQLMAEGMSKKEAILEAGVTRLRPVLMTALTTILGLSTMVFSKEMGADMARPMAIVTIGGLIYGTLLTLVVIPCVYDMMIREKRVKEE